MALPLIGLGDVTYNGAMMTAMEGLEQSDILPIKHLKAKEGLSLINGTQAMTSVASLAVLEAYKLIRFSEHNVAMTYEALTGIEDVFFDKIHKITF